MSTACSRARKRAIRARRGEATVGGAPTGVRAWLQDRRRVGRGLGELWIMGKLDFIISSPSVSGSVAAPTSLPRRVKTLEDDGELVARALGVRRTRPECAQREEEERGRTNADVCGYLAAASTVALSFVCRGTGAARQDPSTGAWCARTTGSRGSETARRKRRRSEVRWGEDGKAGGARSKLRATALSTSGLHAEPASVSEAKRLGRRERICGEPKRLGASISMGEEGEPGVRARRQVRSTRRAVNGGKREEVAQRS
ncbi:hypothetical protein B0H10DRAFT_662568 [Mycena sp. CBHHK59/15]|nr:hypothetical protein B0H10DRAFT_662568 [Mycena sp. CBHHK59/15]